MPAVGLSGQGQGRRQDRQRYSLLSSPAIALVNRPSVMDSGSGIDSTGRFVPGSREMRPDKT